MPLNALNRYSADLLQPAINPENANKEAAKFGPNLVLKRGKPLGRVSAGANEVQTVTLSGASSGTFTLTFNGQTTVAIAFNAAAATVQTALLALRSIGAGGVTVTGSAGGPYTVTFAGSLAGAPQNVITVGTNGTNGTIAIAVTTKGLISGSMVAWNGALSVIPAVPVPSVVAGGSLGDGTNTSVIHYVSLTYNTASGETTAGPAAVAVVTNTNRTIRIAAIASIPAYVTSVGVYANGQKLGTIPVVSGTAAQTDFLTISSGTPPPTLNTAFQAVNGEHNLAGFCPMDIATGPDGVCYFGDATAVGAMDNALAPPDAAYWSLGIFAVSDLVLSGADGPQIGRFARFYRGNVYTESDALIALF